MTKQQHRARAQYLDESPDTFWYPYYLNGRWLIVTDQLLALYHYLLAYAPDGVREEG